MSRFDLYPSTCVIASVGEPDPTNPTGPPINVLEPTTVSCRFVREQRRIETLNGTYELASMTLYVPAGTTFPDGCTVTVNGTEHTVIRWRAEVDAFGEEEGLVTWLR